MIHYASDTTTLNKPEKNTNYEFLSLQPLILPVHLHRPNELRKLDEQWLEIRCVTSGSALPSRSLGGHFALKQPK